MLTCVVRSSSLPAGEMRESIEGYLFHWRGFVAVEVPGRVSRAQSSGETGSTTTLAPRGTCSSIQARVRLRVSARARTRPECTL